MKCHILFYGKNKKNISICLLKILPRVLSIKVLNGMTNSVDPEQSLQEQSDLGLHYFHLSFCL